MLSIDLQVASCCLSLLSTMIYHCHCAETKVAPAVQNQQNS